MATSANAANANSSSLEDSNSSRDHILNLATTTNGSLSTTNDAQILDFDDGHIPENFAPRNAADSNNNKTNTNKHPYSQTKLVHYSSFVDDKLSTVHVVSDALPPPLVDALYEVTVQDCTKPWGTYVTIDQAQAYLDNYDATTNDDRTTPTQNVSKTLKENRERLAVAAAAHFFKNALTLSSPQASSEKKLMSSVQTYTPSNSHIKKDDTANIIKQQQRDPQLWTKEDHQQKAHGVAVWALASTESSQVPYHLDYAEQIRYEHNIIVPPLLAGTLQCSSIDMTGGDFCVCLDGMDHYEKHGYKGAKQQQHNTKSSSGDFGHQNDTTAEWITVPYRYNRMILQSGHLPHMSTPVKSMQALLPQSGSHTPTNTPTSIEIAKPVKRVILGFNVFGHDYGPLVQAAPEHSDVFRRKVALHRVINSTSKSQSNNSSSKSNTQQHRISLDAISANKGLSKLLVLAKREKVKQELKRAQQQLDQELEGALLEHQAAFNSVTGGGGCSGLSVQSLMTRFGTTDGQTWPSPVDVQVHIHHRISQVSHKESTNDVKEGLRRISTNGDLTDGMVLPSSIISLDDNTVEENTSEEATLTTNDKERLAVVAVAHTQSTKRDNDETTISPIEPMHKVMGPVFIEMPSNEGVAICDLQPKQVRGNRIHKGLCLHHDNVRLVAWKGEDNKNDESSALLEVVRSLTTVRYQVSLDQILSDVGSYDCRNPADHWHATRVSTEDANDPSTGFLSQIEAIPVTLLCITLSLFALDSEEDLSSSSKKTTTAVFKDTLFLANIKRQLVGVSVVFGDQIVTTALNREHSLATGKKHVVIRMRVQSVVPKHKEEQAGPIVFGIILPSTRITILPEPCIQKSTASAPKSGSNLKRKGESAVTRLLIETVRCLRHSSKALVCNSFLLAGPPGVGKTFAVKQAFDACQVEGPTLLLSLGSMLGGGAPSDISRSLEKKFEMAARDCHKDPACVAILFIDECDALLSSDHIAGMLANVLDRCSQTAAALTGQGGDGWQRLVVVAATNRVDSIPAYLRRPGRFDKEIHLGPPTVEERCAILDTLITANAGSSVLSSESLLELAEACVGYVPADLAALVRRAFALALEEGMEAIEPDLFARAMGDVGASVLRDSSLSAPPDTSWDDIAGSLRAKTILRQAIDWPRTKKEPFRNLGLVPPKGILLYGPPGCAKTTLARAAAGASGSGFISLSPADVYGSSYVGEAEAIVRNAFKLARSATPCILFFDEIDSILGSDDSSAGHGMGRSGASAESRVLSTFLNEMDGVDGSWEDGVLVLGATNRPGILDKALLRPGRFDKIIYVPPPDYEGRIAILKKYCDAWKVKEVNVSYLASDEISGSMTGAEIVGACRAAAMQALKLANPNEVSDEPVQVSQEHLEEALKAIKPLLSDSAVLDVFDAFEESCRQ